MILSFLMVDFDILFRMFFSIMVTLYFIHCIITTQTHCTHHSFCILYFVYNATCRINMYKCLWRGYSLHFNIIGNKDCQILWGLLATPGAYAVFKMRYLSSRIDFFFLIVPLSCTIQRNARLVKFYAYFLSTKKKCILLRFVQTDTQKLFLD